MDKTGIIRCEGRLAKLAKPRLAFHWPLEKLRVDSSHEQNIPARRTWF